ncbi:MAG: G1 family glutamic endopeptidase [Stellaceae bacterium]
MKSCFAHCLCAAAFVAFATNVPAAAQTSEFSPRVPLLHRPMMPYLNPDGTFKRLRGLVESANWAGYAVTANAPYTSASASWQVPNVVNDGVSSGTEYVLNWVGIGGFADQTLIQLGTEEAVSTSGATAFYAWYELYPAPLVYVSLTVHPGDIMSASLQCVANCSPSLSQTWQLTITDQTTQSAWTENFQYQSSMASADWITEAPYSGTELPLADYVQATYAPVEANGDNPDLSLSANGIYTQDPYGETSNPSAPVNGNDFSTCWGANGAGLTPCTAGSITTSSATTPPPPAPPPPPPAPPPPPPPPNPNNASVTLTATPPSLKAGQASKLTWTSTNTTSCTGNGFTVGNSGKYVSGPFAWALVFPKVTTSYSITCTGPSGSATSMATVTVK